MRPKSIVNFERIVLLNILLGIVTLWLSWDKMQAAQQAALAEKGQAKMVGMVSSLTIGMEVLFVAVYLLLVWLIARKASPVAKWIYVVLAVIGLVLAVIGLGKAAALGTVPMVLGLLGHVLSLISLWLLFRPDSKAWFNEGRAADPSDLR
jgi:hypothetical protein